jgi:hypothetical protein
MADKKISALTALTAANVAPATDVVPIVDTSATETKKVTAKDLVDGALNGGTANGVLYLNGSKAATSGSALVFDGTNLGIGTSSPGARLDVVTGTARWRISNDGSGNIINEVLDSTGAAYRDYKLYGLNLISYTSGTERMRLDSSGNLGIGTSSPGQRLTVNGASSLGGSVNSVLIADGTFAAGVASISANSGARLDIGTAGANAVHFWANNVERLRIESSGSIRAGAASALATTATDGFLYVPTCAGVPTGTPTAVTGMAPIVVDTTNNRWYFYSGGAWRNAGP